MWLICRTLLCFGLFITVAVSLFSIFIGTRVSERSPFQNASYSIINEDHAYLIFRNVSEFEHDAWIDVREEITFVVDGSFVHGTVLLTSSPVFSERLFGSSSFVRLSKATVIVSSEEEREIWEESLLKVRKKLWSLTEKNFPVEPQRVAPPDIPYYLNFLR